MDPKFVRKFSFSANVHACSTNTVSDLYELQREHNSHFHLQKPTFFLLYTKPGICFHPKDSALTPNLPLKEKKKTQQAGCLLKQATPFQGWHYWVLSLEVFKMQLDKSLSNLLRIQGWICSEQPAGLHSPLKPLPAQTVMLC